MATATPPAPGPISGRAAVPRSGHVGVGSAGPAGYQWTAGRAAVPSRPPAAPTPAGSGGGRSGPPAGRPALVAGRRRPRWRRILLTSALALLLVGLLGGAGLWFYAGSLEENMDRTDAFGPLAERPAASIAGALNILLLGSDSRDPEASDDVYRADTIMLMHVPAAADRAYLISIPRDLWVYVPPNADGSAGGREAKINAATAFGGAPLMVQTVEAYTGVRIDHLMMIDFGGFVEVTDALGGVEMDIEQTIQSIHGQQRVFEAGRQHLTGEEALDYIRQRYQFADGDFTRMRNQQQFLRALLDKAASTGTLSNPVQLNAFLQTATSTLTVDEEFSLLPVGWQFRHLRGDNLTFLTSPHAGTGTADGQSVVFSDDEAASELYAAVREDRVGQWVAEHSEQASAG